MGIEIRQSGEAALYAGAGRIIGKAEKAKEERARTERQQAQAQQIAAQQTARQMAQEWEIQKMMLNSQQDFAHEQRLRQADLDAEARAKEWEVDKMALHSRMDFEQQERERNKQYANMLDAFAYTKDRTDLQPEAKENIDFITAQKYAEYGFPEALNILGSSQEYMERQKFGKVLSSTERMLMNARKEKDAGGVYKEDMGMNVPVKVKATGEIKYMSPEGAAKALTTGVYEQVTTGISETKTPQVNNDVWPGFGPKYPIPDYLSKKNKNKPEGSWKEQRDYTGAIKNAESMGFYF